jgi:hypothetical protein
MLLGVDLLGNPVRGPHHRSATSRTNMQFRYSDRAAASDGPTQGCLLSGQVTALPAERAAAVDLIESPPQWFTDKRFQLIREGAVRHHEDSFHIRKPRHTVMGAKNRLWLCTLTVFGIAQNICGIARSRMFKGSFPALAKRAKPFSRPSVYQCLCAAQVPMEIKLKMRANSNLWVSYW